ncbi:MAG: hypothetical protein V3W41_02680 [Planctomycetota bacterium]
MVTGSRTSEYFWNTEFAPNPQIFRFECLSGATGALISQVGSTFLRGDGMADVGDINGDGFDDYVLSSRATNLVFPGGGSASIFSGADNCNCPVNPIFLSR